MTLSLPTPGGNLLMILMTMMKTCSTIYNKTLDDPDTTGEDLLTTHDDNSDDHCDNTDL